MKLKPNSKLIFLFFAALLFGCGNKKGEKLLLPVFGEKKVVNEDTVYHTVGEFSFKNQFGETVSNQTVKNKIYVADFFFASCQSICPVMSGNLQEVQRAFANDDSVLILSHSVNPMHDTVEILNIYGDKYGAKKNKWHLLTGDKKKIYDLARNSYMVNAIQDDGTPEGFLHSELFLLVDTKGRVRGMYDGTDNAGVNKLIEDIKILKKESQSQSEK